MFLLALVFCVVVFFIFGISFSQIIIPLWRDEPLFPFFSEERIKSKRRLKEARERLANAKIIKEVREIEESIKQISLSESSGNELKEELKDVE